MTISWNQEKNKKIFFIWRLEKEKGIHYLLDIIKKSIELSKNIEYHIFWDGSYYSYFSHFDKNFVKIYWKIDREALFDKLKQNADFLIMPSDFLETFGLSALEALKCWIPVIWFKKWWLSDFISDELSLDENNIVDSFFDIIDKNNNPNLVNITDFDYDKWVDNLSNLTNSFKKILLVHDYEELVWWAEIYVNNLKSELEKIWKIVEVFSYKWHITPNIRKKLFLKSLYNPGIFKELNNKITNFGPDLIWSHTILRYIGYHWILAINKSNIKHFITHHDLWLFCYKPSHIINTKDIPSSVRLGSWINKANGAFVLLKTIIKWMIVVRIWNIFPKNTTHFFPSKWMEEIGKNWNIENIKIFPHTVFPKNKNPK